MSTLNVTTIQSNTAATPPVIRDSAGTQIGTFCRAWVVFNGIGTVSIDGAFNVSSITDVATGSYQVNFATAMPDTNYACVASCTTDGVTFNGWVIPSQTGTGKTTSLIQANALAPTNGAGTPFAAGFAYDPIEMSVSIFR